MFDGKEIEAKMQVHYMSFSAHADAKGITNLIRQCQPRNVVLVHGEDLVMNFLQDRVKEELSSHMRSFVLTLFDVLL
jgi:integrator complex subunit 11